MFKRKLLKSFQILIYLGMLMSFATLGFGDDTTETCYSFIYDDVLIIGTPEPENVKKWPEDNPVWTVVDKNGNNALNGSTWTRLIDDVDYACCSFYPVTSGTHNITAKCGESEQKLKLVVVDAKLMSLKFTSDHNLLLDNNMDWTSAGNRYPKPEWVDPESSAYPISQSKNTSVTMKVKIKVKPAGLSFKLTGYGDLYMSFTANATSTGEEQEIEVMAEESLPDQVDIISSSIDWNIKIEDKSDEKSLTVTNHEIYVTYGDPSGSAATEKRIAWCTQTCSGLSDPSSIADTIYSALASNPPTFRLIQPNVPSSPWLLMQSTGYQGQCIDLANLMKLQMAMLGYSDSSIGYVYGSTDTDCSVMEQRICSVHGHEDIAVGYDTQWSSWEAVCVVGNVNYAIKVASGTPLDILRTWLGNNTINGEHQAWLYIDNNTGDVTECTNPGPCPVPKP